MSISSKFFVTLLLSCLIATSGMLLSMRWSISRGMESFQLAKQQQQHQPLLDALGAFHDRLGSWTVPPTKMRELSNIFQSNVPEGIDALGPRPPRGGPNFGPKPPGHLGPRDLVLLDSNMQPLSPSKGRPLIKAENWINFPIHSEKDKEKVVGWISIRKQPPFTEVYEQAFFEYLQTTLWQSALAVLILAGILAAMLSKHFLAPLQQLALRISMLARGDYITTVNTGSRADELGQLGRDLDDLRISLANTDSARKRWLADTSHELRTPLAIARAELEAMQDGVRPIDEANVNAVHEEILQLQRLIEDLSELANSDIGNLRYQKSALNFSQLCQYCIDRNLNLVASEKLSLSANIQPNCWVWGDESRLEQLLTNLLNNSIKYTDSGGFIKLQLNADADTLILTIDDTAPGVTSEQLPLLFNHLYRVENSRNRTTGGSGLGLTIAKRIAEAHEGELKADNAPIGGLKITLTLHRIEPKG